TELLRGESGLCPRRETSEGAGNERGASFSPAPRRASRESVLTRDSAPGHPALLGPPVHAAPRHRAALDLLHFANLQSSFVSPARPSDRRGREEMRTGAEA